MYEVVEAPCVKKYKNVYVVSTISEFSSSLETAGGHWRVDCLLRAKGMPSYFAVLDQGARSVFLGMRGKVMEMLTACSDALMD
ncbi:hypothetical protein ZEAMMB73_Zm00001d048839 [Zea mays]|uniref:Uncharacterized protein n=1 Tax=Zea mays TaxID=4577 RepID=A0A1D6PQK2_MAIZE|nr:hypothetical protein ZEAMMB73_Zm00001d048839 [Zea mays]